MEVNSPLDQSSQMAGGLNSSQMTSPKSPKNKLNKSHGYHDTIKSIRGSHIRDREQYIDQLIEDLKRGNQGLEEQIRMKEQMSQSRIDEFNPDQMENEIDQVNQEKLALENEIRMVQLNIKKMQRDSESQLKELNQYDFRTRKVLEAKKAKLEWERNRELELQQAEIENAKRKELLERKKQEREEYMERKRQAEAAQTKSEADALREEKKISEVLRQKMEEYDRLMKEHKKKQAALAMVVNRGDSDFNYKMKKKEKKEKLENQLRFQVDQVHNMDKQFERLKRLEEKMLNEKQNTQNKTSQLKSQLQDLQNKDLSEKEIEEILAKEKLSASIGFHNKSLHRLLAEQDDSRATRARSPGAPTRFIGGNIGSRTDARKRAHEERDFEKKRAEAAKVSGKASEPPKKPPIRFASPQTKFGSRTNPSVGGAAPIRSPVVRNSPKTSPQLPSNKTIKPASVISPKRPTPTGGERSGLAKASPKVSSGAKLSQPSVASPTIKKASLVNVPKPKPVVKKEAPKVDSSATEKKTIMRGRGNKKSSDDKAEDQSQTSERVSRIIAEVPGSEEKNRESPEDKEDNNLPEMSTTQPTLNNGGSSEPQLEESQDQNSGAGQTSPKESPPEDNSNFKRKGNEFVSAKSPVNKPQSPSGKTPSQRGTVTKTPSARGNPAQKTPISQIAANKTPAAKTPSSALKSSKRNADQTKLPIDDKTPKVSKESISEIENPVEQSPYKAANGNPSSQNSLPKGFSNRKPSDARASDLSSGGLRLEDGSEDELNENLMSKPNTNRQR